MHCRHLLFFFKPYFKKIWGSLLLICSIMELGELSGLETYKVWLEHQFGLMLCLSVGGTGKASKAPSLVKPRV